jgi:uncharacterized protein (TIGR02996 family)
MRTFEFVEGASSKFWNITLSGKSFTVQWGRIGTAGQSQEKTFPDEAKAQKEHDKLVAEKLKKGYTETTPKAKAAPISLRDALEAALDDNPDDRAAWMAYADHLAESGEPRGEFMQVQLALEDGSRKPAERKELQVREQELLKKHRKAWLGPLGDALKEKNAVRWARGVLDAVTFTDFGFKHAPALKALPAARFLRSLTAETVDSYTPDYGDDPPEGVHPDRSTSALSMLADAPFLPHLRHLSAGEEVPHGEETYSSNYTQGHGLPELLKATPRLESFAFYGKNLNLKALFGLTLPRLQSLIVYHVRDRHPLGVLAVNPGMPALEYLRVRPSHQWDNSAVPRAEVVKLLRSPHFPKLRELHLHASDLGNAGCRDVVDSGVLKRVEVLDLSFGCISDAGVRTLLASPDIHRLKTLDLSYNEITDEGGALLAAVSGPAVHSDGQSAPGANEYLYAGDIE